MILLEKTARSPSSSGIMTDSSEIEDVRGRASAFSRHLPSLIVGMFRPSLDAILISPVLSF